MSIFDQICPDGHDQTQSAKPATRTQARTTVRAGLFALVALLLSGCGLSIDYKRLTYDVLRQADCRQNDVNEFCARTFVFEYDEYEIIRREFLRLESEKFTDHMSANERYQALHPDF